MMKRSLVLLMSMLLLSAACACAQELQAEDVKTMEEAAQFVDPAELAPCSFFSLAQENGFEPKNLSPEEAYKALQAAYDDGREAATANWLREWGIDMELYGRPERCALGEDVRLGNRFVSLEALVFGSQYGDEQSLLFMKEEYGEWQMIDYVQGGAKRICVLSDEGEEALALIETETLGHGTGFSAQWVGVYNPVNRAFEAAYTREGYSCTLADRNLFVSSWADYSPWGLRIVNAWSFGGYEWQDDGTQVFTQRAQRSDVSVYAYDVQKQALHLRVHEEHEGLSPAVLRATDVESYLSGKALFLY